MLHHSIVFCGYNVFPLGYAQTQRLLLIAKGLKGTGVKVQVLCRYGTYDSSIAAVEAKGDFEGVPYLYCSGSPYRNSNFVLRNGKKLLGLIREFSFLLLKRIQGELDYIFVCTNSFPNVLYYSFISRLLLTKSVIDNTEYWSAIDRHRFKLLDKLYDKYSPLLCNRIICISDFLYRHSLKSKGSNQVLKIPAIVDFSKFEEYPAIENHNKFMMFCGSLVYFEVIDFVISSFENMEMDSVGLVLVASNGNHADFLKLQTRLANSSKRDLITFESDISYERLVGLYKSSLALLIPMRNTMEDIARFPHKLGEYTAAKGVIITNDEGEIPNYFYDMDNALVCKNFSVQEYSSKMEYAVKYMSELSFMRARAYKTGMLNFDYRVLGEQIGEFLFNRL